MKIDRDVQKRLLNTLADRYPNKLHVNDLQGIANSGAELTANAAYLHEHGLVEAQTTKSLSQPVALFNAKITAQGMDFLADDGGLTAILRVVTVRLEADTVRQLMEMKIEQSDLSTHEKSRLKEALRNASSEGLKELTRRLVQAGIEHGPNAIQWLGTLTGP
ncbi:hypothetical protein ACLD0W_12715 [Alloalcanivorax sp. C16-1]|uniref:hypothetical protein n=1 Tax=Alloalcanivorax sp. C16-1 TaxID=3390051 RepID=UPI003970679E